MSMEVHHFLNDSGGNFTETAPRPPVPGEENELLSNGGNSTRSSGSYKSHVSAKSVPSNMAHSPAATPRRSNLDRNNISSMSLSESKLIVDGDPDKYLAPLGFEPEGSAASSPHFNENSTPPYLKWAESFEQLLDDSEGVKLFKQFCDQEQCTNSLDFFFACKGIKLAGSDRLQNVAKVIYKKFIKGEKLNIRSETKRAIVERIKSDQVDSRIFEVAQSEVECAMQGEAYPLFLKSDIYVQYVQAGGESPKTANSSGSNSARPMSSGPLPTLHEGEELSQEDIRRNEPTLALTPEALIFTHEQRSKWNNFRRPDGLFPPGSAAAAAAKAGGTGGRMVSPYHVSYAPVSAQDSELQSLSSDAHTDDTMSLTDGSV
ncbi:hypothetical protein CAPTEDRAFT_223633 [Capitella teleta]|uniref:RGS domain-containing protein n=1 Tax=Capitella teleta TaxID=283909 RepID=R7V390_CAPTE|nr:hypothetical protein CAPTEDRAFT_223633 [Capitella teleta]|eukprot:ELU10791.1 hypothetical protein CAPTEDRAFT_223633 [Capitella teleta]